MEREQLTALRLGFIDEYAPMDSLSMAQVPMSFQEASDMISSIEDRLRSRCCGLLEVRRTPDHLINLNPGEGSISLLHRSVRDFWKDPITCRKIEVETEKIDFEPSEHLLASILFQAKKLFVVKPSDEEGRMRLINIIRDFLIHCEKAETALGAKQYEYLRELDIALSTLWRIKTWYSLDKAGWGHFISRRLSLLLDGQRDAEPVLTVAVHSRLVPCVESWIKSIPVAERSALFASILIRLITWSLCSVSRLHMMKYADLIYLLLRSGYDVTVGDNETIPLAKSPWKRILSIDPFAICLESLPAREGLPSHSSTTDAICLDQFMAWVGIIETFISVGADLDRKYRDLPAMQSARDVIETRLHLQPEMRMKISEDEIRVIKDRIAEIRKFVYEIPVDTSIENNAKARRLKILARNRRHEQRRKVVQERRAERLANSQPSVGSSSNSDQNLAILTKFEQASPCTRCRTIEALREIGFSSAEAWLGLEQANAGNDLVAIATWILENRCFLPKSLQPSCTERDISINFEGPVSKAPSARQKAQGDNFKSWTQVVKSHPPVGIHTVTGAETVETVPIKTIKRRRKPKKSTDAPQGVGPSSEMGVIDLGTAGRFTWIRDLEHTPHSTKAQTLLSVDQKEALEAFVGSLLVS